MTETATPGAVTPGSADDWRAWMDTQHYAASQRNGSEGYGGGDMFDAYRAGIARAAASTDAEPADVPPPSPSPGPEPVPAATDRTAATTETGTGSDFGSGPRRFRRRSPVEARRWDGTAAGATPVIDWILSGDGTARYHDESAAELHIDAPGFKTLKALPGDWVIRDDGFFPVPDARFRELFEPASAK